MTSSAGIPSARPARMSCTRAAISLSQAAWISGVAKLSTLARSSSASSIRRRAGHLSTCFVSASCAIIMRGLSGRAGALARGSFQIATFMAQCFSVSPSSRLRSPLKSLSIFAFIAASILISGGQGRLKPSPGSSFVARFSFLSGLSLLAWRTGRRAARES